MMKLLFFVFMIPVVLLSCDGRNRAYKSNTEILKSNNLFDSFSKQVNFIPSQSIEIHTDTILSNGFQVKLDYYSIENSFIRKTKMSKNDSKIEINHKNFEANIQVFKNKKLIIEETLNKGVFFKYNRESFLKEAVMQLVWIDYENSTDNYISLNTSFHIPETNIYKDYCIQIDKFGTVKIKEIILINKLS